MGTTDSLLLPAAQKNAAYSPAHGTHPGHLHSGRHTLAGSQRHSLRDQRNIREQRHIQIQRQTQTAHICKYRHFQTYSNTKTFKHKDILKYSNRFKQSDTLTSGDTRPGTTRLRIGVCGSARAPPPRGRQGGGVRAHTTARSPAANLLQFTTDRRTQTF